MALSDQDLSKIVMAYEADAISYSGSNTKLHQNRIKLLNYYNLKPNGLETEGLSQVVTSEVFEVVEGMIPQLMRLLMQNRDIGKFTANSDKYDEEAGQKTKFTNYIFRQKHNATHLISSMLKDGLLLYTGWIKTYQDQKKRPYFTTFEGQSQDEYDISLAELKDNEKVVNEEQDKDTGLWSYSIESITATNEPKVEIVPPDNCLIGKGARDFENPEFIGERTRTTFSELRSMGFSKEKLKNFSSGANNDNSLDQARNHNLNGGTDGSTGLNDKSKEEYWLGEYYLDADVDEDGIAEKWQVFIINGTILSKHRVDDHPYSVFVPIPIPHRAIGTCPAEQIAPLQLWKSSLARGMNDNIFINNFNRCVANELIDADDYLTPSVGGLIQSEGTGPVQNNIMPLPILQQTPAILEGLAYVDSSVEKVSGVTAYNQGMDTDSLNKTATGFQGIKDMSMMRIEVIARQAADTLAQVFKKIALLAMRYQNEDVQIRVHGEVLEFNPQKAWKDRDCHCDVDVGLGAGERQEKIANLNAVIATQNYIKETNPATTLVDEVKQFNVLDSLMQAIGFKETERYYNNPEKPQDIILAQLEAALFENQQMKMQIENPLVASEQRKGEIKLIEQKQKQEHDMNMKMAEMEQSDSHFNKKLVFDLTKLEVDSKQNIPGSSV